MPYWRDVSKLKQPFAKLISERSVMCSYMTEAVPAYEAGFVFEGDEITRVIEPPHNLKTLARLGKIATGAFRRAGYRSFTRFGRPYLWHWVGTARFGADPATSVLDPNCQVHGVSGLYVVDASVLPSAGAVNTGLTIFALALRAGDHIAKVTSRPARQSDESRLSPEPLIAG